jgi:hypothetical protein
VPGSQNRHTDLTQESWRGLLRLGCAPLVAVVKPANLRYRNDGAAVRRVHRPRFRFVVSTIQDIDGDGEPDLVATFEMRKMKLHPSATSARLSGWLKNSQVFIGEDAVTVVSTMATASCR